MRRRKRRHLYAPPRRRIPPGWWVQTGSGCLLVGHRRYPCDATYTRRGGDEIVLRCTYRAFHELPGRVRTGQVWALVFRPGVVVHAITWTGPQVRAAVRRYLTLNREGLRHGTAKKGAASARQGV